MGAGDLPDGEIEAEGGIGFWDHVGRGIAKLIPHRKKPRKRRVWVAEGKIPLPSQSLLGLLFMDDLVSPNL